MKPARFYGNLSFAMATPGSAAEPPGHRVRKGTPGRVRGRRGETPGEKEREAAVPAAAGLRGCRQLGCHFVEEEEVEKTGERRRSRFCGVSLSKKTGGIPGLGPGAFRHRHGGEREAPALEIICGFIPRRFAP